MTDPITVIADDLLPPVPGFAPEVVAAAVRTVDRYVPASDRALILDALGLGVVA